MRDDNEYFWLCRCGHKYKMGNSKCPKCVFSGRDLKRVADYERQEKQEREIYERLKAQEEANKLQEPNE